MKIFIAGAGGYIGTYLTQQFSLQGHDVVALDCFFFGDTLAHLAGNRHLTIVRDDIRTFTGDGLSGADVSIDLAAISNDPASALDPELTKQINYHGAVRLARLSKQHGVKRHFFISSCSVYGAADGEVSETSLLNPLTEYARSKVAAERIILDMKTSTFMPTVFRLATMYGLSLQRMRFDLLVNIMTLHAYKNNVIKVLGGGKQWRPLLHLDDLVRAISLAIQSEAKIAGEIFNVGSTRDNYQVADVAEYFRDYFPGLVVEYERNDVDERSYRVNFDKIHQVLGFDSEETIGDAIQDIRAALEAGILLDDLRTNTVQYYQHLFGANAAPQELLV